MDEQRRTGAVATERTQPDDSGQEEPTGEQARQQASQVTERVQQEAASVSETARAQAGSVAETARGQAQRVADTAASEGARVLVEATDALRAQADEQGERLAATLREVGDQVRALAEGRPEDAGRTSEYASDLADSVTRAGERLSSLGVKGVMDEVQDFARRRPGAFLAGALGLGLISGRVLRNRGGDGQRQPGGPQPEIGPAEPQALTERGLMGAEAPEPRLEGDQ